MLSIPSFVPSEVAMGRGRKKKQNNINVKDFSIIISNGEQWQLTGIL